MKKCILILLLVLLSNQSFSQNDICQKTAQISYEIVHENYQESIHLIKQLDTTFINQTIIDYNLAISLMGLNKNKKAYKLFENIYNESKINLTKHLKCNSVIIFGDEEIANEFVDVSLKQIKNSSLFNMSIINERIGLYALAYQQLNKYYFNQKDKIFLCGTASRIFINGYAKRSTSLLKHLGDYKKINSASIKMLLYVKDEAFLNTLLNSLLKEYKLEQIKNELKIGLKNIKKDKIEILSGRKIERNYIPFFDKKIVIWKNFDTRKKLLENITNNRGYQYIIHAKNKIN